MNKTYAVHTAVANIKRVDEHAQRMRRSRNSLLNEAIEILLERYDAATLHHHNGTKTKPQKKAGVR
jgi:predicted transcriptional regulator